MMERMNEGVARRFERSDCDRETLEIRLYIGQFRNELAQRERVALRQCRPILLRQMSRQLCEQHRGV